MNKFLLLLLILVSACASKGGNATIVDVYTDGNGKQCFYLESNYTDNRPTGVYCKQ